VREQEFGECHTEIEILGMTLPAWDSKRVDKLFFEVGNFAMRVKIILLLYSPIIF